MAPDFRVVAIIAAYNEADIIARVVADLIDQGASVYFLDDGSTDGTAAAVQPFVGHGVLAIEPLHCGAPTAAPRTFDWEGILRRKAEVAREIDADWFIHHDADELRESPWRGLTLCEAVRCVDAAGFNAIDFASFDFWPTHDRFQLGDDLRAAFTHYADRGPYDRVQIRAWKDTGTIVDLVSSGGHDVQFPNRRVCPLRFISRHYPIRSSTHGRQKVFHERLGRFRLHERARGWHVQYDQVQPDASFVRDPSTLTPYDPDQIRFALALRHRGVEALEVALDESRSIIDAHRQELDARAREIDHRGHEIERHARELANRTRDVEDHRRELDRHRRQLDIDRRDLDHCRRELALAGATVERSAIHIRSLEAELARVSGQVAFLETELERSTAHAAERDAALANLHRSLSWRLTAPARALLRAISGR